MLPVLGLGFQADGEKPRLIPASDCRREMLMAEPANRPAERPDGPLHFESREEFEAWTRDEVQDAEAFIADSYASIAAWREWRAAGNTGLPPGFVRFRDYLREHPL